MTVMCHILNHGTSNKCLHVWIFAVDRVFDHILKSNDCNEFMHKIAEMKSQYHNIYFNSLQTGVHNPLTNLSLHFESVTCAKYNWMQLGKITDQ